MSSIVAFAGKFTVFDMDPDKAGWIAAIILTWPIGLIARSPIAQSKTS